MAEPCRICGEPATQTLGGYAFCDRHYARATRQRRGIWQADLASVALLVGFVVVVYLLDGLLQPTFDRLTLPLIGIALALVPAALWLAFFYRRDRLEPEPKGMVLGVFVLGALLGAVGIPVIDQLYDVPGWFYASALTQLLGGILVIGFSQEFLKFAAVRFSVYGTGEFDERTDGIIYATAAGLGLATVLNIAFVVESGGVDLGTGSIRIVLTALAHASFAGITGYFLGRDKLESRPAWWMPMGLSIAAVLNGLFFFLRGTVGRAPVGAAPAAALTPFIGLVLAALLAVAVTLLLSWLIRRELRAAVPAVEA
jgi:RsiW-degrading membrane proteinase PrsW (M82 family)